MKSFMASPSNIERKWYVVDATGHTLGRLSSEIASILRGKNKPTFTPHIDTGDYIVVVNADKIKVTGKKMDQKVYYHHSDYVGGMKEQTLKEKMAKKPEDVIYLVAWPIRIICESSTWSSSSLRVGHLLSHVYSTWFYSNTTISSLK